jgi:hypothetical protein
MKKIVITVGALISLSCSTHMDTIYSSKQIGKSIKNLETMRSWLDHDLKDGTRIDHYDLLIDQTIYNLQRNIDPKRPYNDYSGNLCYVLDRLNGLQITLNYAHQCGHLKTAYYEEITKEVLNIKSTVKLLK